jgi:polysaccharide export outer membrane protein
MTMGNMCHQRHGIGLALFAALVAVSMTGCHTLRGHHKDVVPLPPVAPDVPKELMMTTLPPYDIAPPDILLVDAIRVVPRGTYVVSPTDELLIQATGTYPEYPIAGPYLVESDGTVNLGPVYGSVKVAGKSLNEARVAIDAHLRRSLTSPSVSVSLGATAGRQQISGEHLVAPDGTITLGSYGQVFVAGLTVMQAKKTIEAHLAQYLESPEVAVDMYAYNSKTFFVVLEGGGYGDMVYEFPYMGNETVLSSIAKVNGLQQVSSKKIWVSRPAPDGTGCYQVLPVDWCAITKGGSTATNYQVLPGDRVFVQEDHWYSFDTWVGKVLSPFERVLGFTLLGTATVQAAKFRNNNGVGFF